MLRTRTKEMVLWPEYFNVRATRAQGRRVPKELAVHNPTGEMVLEAVKKTGRDCHLLEDKSYPRTSWKTTGAVAVEKTGSKTELLTAVAKELSKLDTGTSKTKK